jgi:hypothetical protein
VLDGVELPVRAKTVTLRISPPSAGGLLEGEHFFDHRRGEVEREALAQQPLALVRDHEAVADGCPQRRNPGDQRIDERQNQRVPECDRGACDPDDRKADRRRGRRDGTEGERGDGGKGCKWQLDQRFAGKRPGDATPQPRSLPACIYHDGGQRISELVHGG